MTRRSTTEAAPVPCLMEEFQGGTCLARAAGGQQLGRGTPHSSSQAPPLPALQMAGAEERWGNGTKYVGTSHQRLAVPISAPGGYSSRGDTRGLRPPAGLRPAERALETCGGTCGLFSVPVTQPLPSRPHLAPCLPPSGPVPPAGHGPTPVGVRPVHLRGDHAGRRA